MLRILKARAVIREDKRNGFLEGNVLQELLSNIHKEEEFINDEKHVILGFKNGKGRNNL